MKSCFSGFFTCFAAKNFIETVFSATKAHRGCVFYSGFKHAFLISGVGEIWFENGLRESTRPCCFAAAELSFLAGSLCGGGIEGSLFCCQDFIEIVFQLWNSRVLLPKLHRNRVFSYESVGEIWFENGLRESTRPCFAAAELSFLAGSWCGGGIEGSLFCCQNFIEIVFQLWNHVFPAFSRVLLPKTSSKPCFQLGKLTEGVFFL